MENSEKAQKLIEALKKAQEPIEAQETVEENNGRAWKDNITLEAFQNATEDQQQQIKELVEGLSTCKEKTTTNEKIYDWMFEPRKAKKYIGYMDFLSAVLGPVDI